MRPARARSSPPCTTLDASEAPRSRPGRTSASSPQTQARASNNAVTAPAAVGISSSTRAPAPWAIAIMPCPRPRGARARGPISVSTAPRRAARIPGARRGRRAGPPPAGPSVGTYCASASATRRSMIGSGTTARCWRSSPPRTRFPSRLGSACCSGCRSEPFAAPTSTASFTPVVSIPAATSLARRDDVLLIPAAERHPRRNGLRHRNPWRGVNRTRAHDSATQRRLIGSREASRRHRTQARSRSASQVAGRPR
jgi:hypothetical protein